MIWGRLKRRVMRPYNAMDTVVAGDRRVAEYYLPPRRSDVPRLASGGGGVGVACRCDVESHRRVARGGRVPPRVPDAKTGVGVGR